MGFKGPDGAVGIPFYGFIKKNCIIFFFKFSNSSLIINLLCAVAYLVQCLAQCGQTCKENLGHGYL